jgi:DNA-binding NarL/FixJ family response regulator
VVPPEEPCPDGKGGWGLKGSCILFVSRSKDIFPLAKLYAKKFGYFDIRGTMRDGDGLNKEIHECKPRLVFVEANFYDTATPYMLRKLQEKIPWLRLAVFSLGECAPELELRFLYYGIERYISLYHGMADFIHGFKAILDGKTYIAWKLRKRMEKLENIPEPSERESGREDEIMVMLANGRTVEQISKTLSLSERTVAHHKTSIFSRYQAGNMAEMIRAAQNSGKLKLKGMFYLDGRCG